MVSLPSFLKLVLMLTIFLDKIRSFYFDLARTRELCYIEDFLGKYTATIKWKIFSEKYSNDYLNSMVQNFSIKIYHDKTNELEKEIHISRTRDKAPFDVKEDGFYKICVELNGFTWEVRQNLFFGLKIHSENMEHPNLSKAIKLNDTRALSSFFGDVIQNGERLTEKQRSDIAEEDQDYQNRLNIIEIISLTIFFQVILMIFLSVYQLYKYKKVFKEIY